MNSQQTKSQTIKEGIQDDVEVFIDHEYKRAVVKLPNNFDVYQIFGRKDLNDKPYAERFDSSDKSKAVFCVEFQELGTDKRVQDFNLKVISARGLQREIKDEVELYETIIAFDHLDGKKAIYKHRMPDSGYIVGEVVHAGKFFAIFGQGTKENEKFFQIVKTSSLLQGRDEFLNREETIKAKLPIGSKKYLTISETSRISVSDYTPKQVAEPEAVALPITREQKDALMTFREGQGAEWKDKLGVMWMKSTYPGVPKANAPLLQQVRNEQGPEWLHNLKDKDLYLGTAKEPVAKPEPSPFEKKEAEDKVEPSAKKPAVKRAKKLEQSL